ncbi:MAG: DUF5683 domain-containing protein [Spirochaetota bacterium]
MRKRIDPATTAALSLIPGYSGLYRTGDYANGALFSVLEVATVVVALRVYQTQTRIRNSGIIPLPSSSQVNLAIPVSLAVGLLALDAYHSYGEAKRWNSPTKIESKKQTDAIARLWRSALLPGWGQGYAGEKRKGRLFLTGFLGLGSLVGYLDDRAASVERSFDSFQLAFPLVNNFLRSSLTEQSGGSTADLLTYNLYLNYQDRRKEISITRENYAAAITALGAFYVYNLIDAYFFSGSNREDTETKKTSSLQFTPDISFRRTNVTQYFQLENYYSAKLTQFW